jgi:sialate O-acetylesterase
MKLAYKLIFTVLLSCCIFQLAEAAPWELRMDLQGEWKFRIGDDKNWSKPGINDNDWDKLQVPSAWETQGFHTYDG